MLPKPRTLIPWIAMAIVISGCDDQAIRIAREAADRQAQQNTEMATLNKEVASGTQRLVEADAQARKEIIGVHHELQAERTRLDTGRDTLEEERRQIAGERRTESLLAPVTSLVGGLLLALAVLGFCYYVLVAARSSDDIDVRLNEVLIGELVSDEALLSRSESTLSLPNRSDE